MLAVIGGTGFDQWQDWQSVEHKDIMTPYGQPSAQLLFGKLNGIDCVLFSRHGQPHHIPPHKINYRANIWALHSVGVTKIIALAAVGGIDKALHVPCLIVPHDILDYTYGREHTFCDGNAPLQHVDFTWPYDDALRTALITAGVAASVPLHKQGVYAVTQGPRLESAAEIRRFAKDGANIVGMTGMPEAALARELGMSYACIAMSVNPAAGTIPEIISMQQIMQSLECCKRYVYELVRHLELGS